MRACLCLAILIATAAAGSADQLPLPATDALARFVQNKDRGLKSSDPNSAHSALMDATDSSAFSAYLVDLALAEQPDRVDLSEIRGDLQLGSLSGRTASTSVVARPSISEIFSAAIESGAVARKTDDTSVTFSANALMVKQLLSGAVPRGCGSLDNECEHGSGKWLRGLSGSTTFSMAGSTVVPDGTDGIALLGNRKLTALSIRYEMFVRERNNKALETALADFQADQAVQAAAAAFGPAQIAFETHFDSISGDAWRTTTVSLLEAEAARAGDASALRPRLEAVLLQRYRERLAQLAASPEFVTFRAAAFQSQRAYIVLQNKKLAEKLYRKAATIDYVHERPTSQPELHQVRVVFSTPLGAHPKSGEPLRAPTGAFTMNAGVSMFRPDLTPTDGWKVRDAQLSAALDWMPIRTGDFRPTYTVAYYFQYMVANGVITFDKTAITPGGAAIPLPKEAIELLDTKGALHIAQFRASIPAAKGVSFPLAVSWSNRTELITGKSFWQGHAGVSYDLGALKGLLSRK
ncbi:MAG: hypothetical protein ABIT71_24460 [Vicinamibacteraceae bacterium]